VRDCDRVARRVERCGGNSRRFGLRGQRTRGTLGGNLPPAEVMMSRRQ